ncbi:MAG: phytoene/squalene synthase family protein [Dehalococcoidia bacterium]
MELQTQANWEYCEEMLPKVSRTFALNIRELKGDTHRAVLLGYLFFRIADTFEDNTYQSEEEKIKTLYNYSDIFKGNKSLNERLELYESLKFGWREQSPDKELVENGDQVIRCYFDLPAVYREIIDPHIVMTSEGMADFQQRKLDSGLKIFQLQDVSDLEGYCYYVAGVVGMMLTQIFCQQENISGLRSQLENYQVDFGLALQLTNVIKDSQKDLERGWCYLPASVTEKYQVKPEELTGIAPNRKKELLRELLDVILPSYNSTLKYIETIPEDERSVRMFCIIAFVLSYNTLLNIMNMKGSKVSRPQVTEILARCKSFAASNKLLEEDYSKVVNLLRG